MGHPQPVSLRSVPNPPCVTSFQDCISSHALSCLLIGIFSAIHFQEHLSLYMSPTTVRASLVPQGCCSSLKMSELGCYRVPCQTAAWQVMGCSHQCQTGLVAFSTQVTSSAPSSKTLLFCSIGSQWLWIWLWILATLKLHAIAHIKTLQNSLHLCKPTGLFSIL